MPQTAQPVQPPIQPKRAIAFIDGQNLYHGAREAFGYNFPNFNPKALAQAVCTQQSWTLGSVRFYTGVPEHRDDPFWNGFWAKKKLAMSRAGVFVFTRALRYRDAEVLLQNGRLLMPDGTPVDSGRLFDLQGRELPPGARICVRRGEEKGIDVRLALDAIHCTRNRLCDVVLIFSQDQDLSELAVEIKAIASDQRRPIEVASAFPCSANSPNQRGIDKTTWLRIDQATYDPCIDPVDYRPK